MFVPPPFLVQLWPCVPFQMFLSPPPPPLWEDLWTVCFAGEKNKTVNINSLPPSNKRELKQYSIKAVAKQKIIVVRSELNGRTLKSAIKSKWLLLLIHIDSSDYLSPSFYSMAILHSSEKQSSTPIHYY